MVLTAETVLMYHPNIKNDYETVKKLGDAMGYGHLMSMASAIWKAKLREGGGPEEGAFVPTISYFIKDEYQDTLKDGELYDVVVKEFYGR